MCAPRLLVQADWNVALRASTSSDKQIWSRFVGEIGGLAVRESTQIQIVRTADGTCSQLIPDNPCFLASVAEGVLHVSFTAADSFQWSAEFLPPSSTLSTIYGVERKSIETLDVAEGGLGVCAATSDSRVLVWDSATGGVERAFDEHVADVNRARFFPSGLVVLSGGVDMQLRVCSVETAECVRLLAGHVRAISDVGFVGRGGQVVSCSKDGTAKVWDVGAAQCVRTADPRRGQLLCLHVDAGAATLAVGSERGDVLLQDMRAAADVRLLRSSAAAVTALKFLTADSLVYGTASGEVVQQDLRNPGFVVCSVESVASNANRLREATLRYATDRGACRDLLVSGQVVLASFGDGSVLRVAEGSQFELTGADVDAVYALAADSEHVYSACRDGLVRKYGSLAARS